MQRPFHEQDVENIRLSRAPLVRVFAQVRWQEITALKTDFDARAKAFGLAIAEEYPYTSESKEINLLLTPQGPQQQEGGTIVQLRSADDKWRVYFTATFLTLETTDYYDINDFSSRFSLLLEELARQVKIPAASRLGFRYVDRLSEPHDMQDLDRLVRPEVRGGQQVPLGETFNLTQSFSESLFVSGSESLLAKWATLPAGATLDPSIEPVSTTSWVLDLDAFREAHIAFDSEVIVNELRSLSLLGYKFFRWAVKDEFLDRFGAAE